MRINLKSSMSETLPQVGFACQPTVEKIKPLVQIAHLNSGCTFFNPGVNVTKKTGKSFGDWVRDRRKELGLTQEQLGERARLKGAYISRIERGERHTTTNAPTKPSIEAVDRLGKALEVSPAEAREAAGYGLSGSTQPIPALENSEFAVLYHGYNRLTPNRKQEFNRILRMVRAELDRLDREQQKGK